MVHTNNVSMLEVEVGGSEIVSHPHPHPPSELEASLDWPHETLGQKPNKR